MNIIKPILRKVVQPLVFPVTGLPISGEDSEEPWSSYWLILTNGLIQYRKGSRNGHYVIDYSSDGGLTWELNLVVMELDEDSIIINIDAGIEGYRHELRYDSYCIDVELTTTGFDGIKGTDWENVFVIGYDYTVIKYGLLFNWYAATDPREITSAGWHVPTNSEIQALSTFLGGNSVSGGKLKTVGTTYWEDTGGTNISGFNAKASGIRDAISGEFLYGLGTTNFSIWSSTQQTSSDAYYWQVLSYFNGVINYNINKKQGCAIRLIKDSTTLSDGQQGTYQGNDGKVYRTICIGTQEWLADNLAETKYRNGDDIPEVTYGAIWVALETGALCAYNNDWDNV